MRLLLDTHIFLWIAQDDPQLRANARALIESAESVHVSSVTIWEVAIKVALGKLNAVPEELILEMEVCGFRELPVSVRHAAQVSRLPPHHRDPFDRLLVAQAISESMLLLTVDKQLAAYSELVIQA